MQEMGLIDDVKSLSGEGNNMDCTRQPVSDGEVWKGFQILDLLTTIKEVL